MSNKIHTVSGHNFHGNYSVTVRGAAEGFTLSPKQAKKIANAICGMSDCTCGGGYGNGPDSGSARIEHIGYDKVQLIPSA